MTTTNELDTMTLIEFQMAYAGQDWQPLDGKGRPIGQIRSTVAVTRGFVSPDLMGWAVTGDELYCDGILIAKAVNEG
jgi:hypothetical protein